jgi:(4-O-methyl)-D-glucuronate---lignin esterase
LVCKDGTKVTSAEMWFKKRRPEIVEDFDREIYGRMPKVTPKVKWEVTDTKNETVGGVPVVTKTLVGHVDNSSYTPITVNIQLTLTTPADAKGPVPVIMEFGFVGFGGFGGFSVAATPGQVLSAGAQGQLKVTADQKKKLEELQKTVDDQLKTILTADQQKQLKTMQQPGGGRGGFGGAGGGPSWQQQVLSKGWGYAIIAPNSIQADNGAGLTSGIIGLCNKGQPRKPDDWGALRAWAWGASRALDYFETDKAVDAKKVGIEGLSRYGKAAIVTLAYDERFAIGFIGSSGEGGVKLHRRNWGELVENVASSGEYHWMAGNFIKYAGPLKWDDLPIDSHELVAMCAPRPVFISAGTPSAGDGWVDAKGMFLAGVGAGPVYKLLGKKDLGTTEFPAVETALIDGTVAFRQHSGGHTTGPNWPTFLKFADRYLKSH